MRDTAFLEVRNLSVSYLAGRKVTTRVVDDVSFSLSMGERTVLMGRSGCGKSTILKAVGGFLEKYEGSISVDGAAAKRPGPDRMVVWQDHDQLLPWKTVLENVAYPLELRKEKGAREQAAAWLEKVGLSRALNQYPHQLSGGMKMRVAIARGFAARPKVFLMDEPFSALDALTREKMQDLLMGMQRETRQTLLFVTHDISEAVRLGDQIIVLSSHPGRIIRKFDATRLDPLALAAEIRELIFREEREDA